MQKLRILNRILKRIKAYHVITVFIGFVMIVSLILMLVEPGINNYWDALWYSYVNLFTIGFGDIVPVTPIGRILSVLLTIYATLVIGIVTAVIVAFYQNVVAHKYEETRESLIDKLSNLDKLNKDQLKKIADSVKEINR